MGLISGGDRYAAFSLVPLFDNDVWRHALPAIIAASCGRGPVPAGADEVRTA